MAEGPPPYRPSHGPTPVGLVPASLEDLNPFAHLDAPSWCFATSPNTGGSDGTRVWGPQSPFFTVDIHGDGMKQRLAEALDSLGLSNDVHRPPTAEQRDEARRLLRHDSNVDKQMVLLNTNRAVAENIMAKANYAVNRGTRKNINDKNDQHLFSPRHRDGGLSVATAGALALLEQRTEAFPTSRPRTEWWGHASKGPACRTNSDAEPFVRKGRNVFHGFVVASASVACAGRNLPHHQRTGQFLGHGVSQRTPPKWQGSPRHCGENPRRIRN